MSRFSACVGRWSDMLVSVRILTDLVRTGGAEDLADASRQLTGVLIATRLSGHTEQLRELLAREVIVVDPEILTNQPGRTDVDSGRGLEGLLESLAARPAALVARRGPLGALRRRVRHELASAGLHRVTLDHAPLGSSIKPELPDGRVFPQELLAHPPPDGRRHLMHG